MADFFETSWFNWAFAWFLLQIVYAAAASFLLLIKLFRLLLLLQRGQATTRVVYNIKFMTRWDFSWTSFVMRMQWENMNTTYIKQRFGWWCTSYFFLADVIQEQKQMLNNLRMAYPVWLIIVFKWSIINLFQWKKLRNHSVLFSWSRSNILEFLSRYKDSIK